MLIASRQLVSTNLKVLFSFIFFSIKLVESNSDILRLIRTKERQRQEQKKTLNATMGSLSCLRLVLAAVAVVAFGGAAPFF